MGFRLEVEKGGGAYTPHVTVTSSSGVFSSHTSLGTGLSNWFCAQKLESVVSSKNTKVREHLLPCHLVSEDPKKDFVIVE